MAPPKQPWFRFYVEATTDRKLRRISPAQRWLWVAVLCAAKQSPQEGWLLLTDREPLTVDDIADLAGMKPKEVQAGLGRMVELGLLVHDQEAGALRIVAWANRQYASDDSTARTRKHRSRDVPTSPPPPDDGTSHPRPRNGEATPKERRRNGPETETETESSSSGSSTTPTAPDPVADEETELRPEPEPRPAVVTVDHPLVAETIERLAKLQLQRRRDGTGPPIADERSWLTAARLRAHLEHAEAAARHLTDRPDLSPYHVAQILNGAVGLLTLKPVRAAS